MPAYKITVFRTITESKTFLLTAPSREALTWDLIEFDCSAEEDWQPVNVGDLLYDDPTDEPWDFVEDSPGKITNIVELP
jgi:hypothetical protein